MKKSASVCLIFILSTTLLSSCKKDSENNDTTAVQESSMAEAESNRMIQAINFAAWQSNVRGTNDFDSLLSPCATITVDTPAAGLKSITVDFGDSVCFCSNWDQKYRQGKIIATWTGLYRDSGTVITITTENYYQGALPVQMNRYDFTKTVTNMGHNVNGNLHFEINVTQGLITYYSGETFTWTSLRDREWIQGESTTFNLLDDKYSITGSASGVDRNGNPFTVTITSPVIFALICPYIESGTLEITHGNLPSATLDYGDGSCDAKATITINGNTIEFVIG